MGHFEFVERNTLGRKDFVHDSHISDFSFFLLIRLVQLVFPSRSVQIYYVLYVKEIPPVISQTISSCLLLGAFL